MIITRQRIKSFLDTKKTAIFFSIASTIYSLSLMVSNILILYWVSPENIGLWNTLFIFQGYAFFLQLGILNGLNRDLPFYFGKGEPKKAHQLASAALWVVKIIIIVSFAIGIVTAGIIYFKSSYSFNFKLTLFTVGILTIIFFYQNYLIVTFRTNKAFRRLAQIYIINSFIIVLSLILVWKFNYHGHLFRIVLLSIMLTLFLHIYRPLKSVLPVYSRKNIKELIATGLPLFSAGYIGAVALTINRWFLLTFAGVVYVGYYSPALAILVVVKMFPQQIGQYLYPKMSYEVGKAFDREKLWSWVWKSALGLMLILTPIGIIGWFLLPPFIEMFFSEYSEGIFAAQLAIISGILSGSLIGINILNSLKYFKTMAILNMSKLIMYVLFMFIGIKYFEPLTGVALGMVVSDFLFLFLVLYVCKKKLFQLRTEVNISS